MEKKCKNCMCFYAMPTHGDGSKGTCGQTGDLVVHHREDVCDCASFMELPKVEKIKRTIEKVLKPWIRERDSKFVRAMELVAHIGQLFEAGEFKVFDAVKSASEMKALVFHGKETLHNIDKIWTYHCPWNEDIELFIAITTDGKMVKNTYDDRYIDVTGEGVFMTEWFDTGTQFEECMRIIDLVRDNCIMKSMVMPELETEHNKCVSDKNEEWRESALKHPINKEDDELIHNVPWAMETFLGMN